MVRVGVMGAAGYAGIELTRILLGHPGMDVVAITSNTDAGRRLDEVYPAFLGQSDLVFVPHDEALEANLDAIFLALPHTASMARVPDLLAAGVSVFDLSADFRLTDPAVFERWYAAPHTCPQLLAEAVYGLPELFGGDLARLAERHAAGEAVLVSCPGCYPTATMLAAWPTVAAGLVAGPVVVDAISGVTGAGRTASTRTHYCQANENLEAYGVGTHRHTPEIEQNLARAGKGSYRVIFTPHLAPLSRGLLSTVTMRLSDDAAIDAADLRALYERAYDACAFVDLCPEGTQPRTASVVGTNRAQVGVAYVEEARCVVATGAIDNLSKGAAGQAVQCANLVMGLDETAGLGQVACAV